MKKKLVALPVGLVASLMGSSVFANSVFFEGSITAETCPIEIVNPGDGSVDNRVSMGDVAAGRFPTTGTEVRGAAFAVRVPDKAICQITEDNALVTFNGDADGTGDYFKVNPVNGAATGVSIVIRDLSNASIKPGGTSVAYPLNASGPTDLRFDAYYRSTATAVTAGPASAHVRYSVAYN